MKSTTVGLPQGFRDLMIEQARRRRRIETAMASVFERHGYGEIVPSSVESMDLYRRGHQSIQERAFRFLDRNDNLLALRADFTPAIARIAASRFSSGPQPVRLWYSGSVYRKTDGKRGRYAELSQIGAELLGLNSIERDVELLRLAFECLDASGITDIQVHLNDAGIFRGTVESLGLDPQQIKSLRTEIHRKDARGLATRLEGWGVDADLRNQVATIARCIGGVDVLDRVHALVKAPVSRAAIERLRELADAAGQWKNRIVIDLTEIDEMEYYTGIMMSFLSPTLNRELGKGGRYDSLLKEFGWDAPAIGFSFSLDSLAELA